VVKSSHLGKTNNYEVFFFFFFCMFSEGKAACRPKEFESCACPDGETVEVDLKAALQKKFLKNSPCGEGIAPVSCLCEDDSTFVPFILSSINLLTPFDAWVHFCSSVIIISLPCKTPPINFQTIRSIVAKI
jgi:hypothetical protein